MRTRSPRTSVGPPGWPAGMAREASPKEASTQSLLTWSRTTTAAARPRKSAQRRRRCERGLGAAGRRPRRRGRRLSHPTSSSATRTSPPVEGHRHGAAPAGSVRWRTSSASVSRPRPPADAARAAPGPRPARRGRAGCARPAPARPACAGPARRASARGRRPRPSSSGVSVVSMTTTMPSSWATAVPGTRRGQDLDLVRRQVDAAPAPRCRRRGRSTSLARAAAMMAGMASR